MGANWVKAVTWADCRAVIEAELDARGWTRNELIKRAGLPQTVGYGLFGDDRQNVRFDNVARLVAALGRSMGWLERQARKGRAVTA